MRLTARRFVAAALAAALAAAAPAAAVETPPAAVSAVAAAGGIDVAVLVAARTDPGDLELRVRVAAVPDLGPDGALASPVAQATLAAVPAGFPGGEVRGRVALPPAAPAGVYWWQPLLTDAAGTVVAAGTPAQVGAFDTPAPAAAPVREGTGDLGPDLAAVARAARPAVYRVTAVTGRRVSVGSGFLVAARHVVTNAHVVGTARTVRVRPAGGPPAVGTVVARDARADIALVRLPRPSRVAPLRFAAAVSPGDGVVALGFPYGAGLSTPGGAVRDLLSGDGPGGRDLVETSIPLYPGSSGGPVLNARGRVVGLVVAGQLGVIAGTPGEGTSFAVAAGTARRTVGGMLRGR